MTEPIRCRLPSTFTSLYRLFLRTNSASVLHQRHAKRNLRKLWRPVFDDAVMVIKRLQNDPDDSAEREGLERWLTVWQARMDNTLSLLYNSARSRGISHEITKNLAWLFRNHRAWTAKRYYSVSQHWKPQLPPKSLEYSPKLLDGRAKTKATKERRYLQLDEKAWGALGQVVRMAEGRHGLCFGKMTFRERKV